MYEVTEYEFLQFKVASKRLEECKQEHTEELQQVYDDIHPTRSQFDYGLGIIYVESICPAEYAAYLVDMQAKHERIELYWEERAKAYRDALKVLTEEEQEEMKNSWPSEKVRLKVKRELEYIILTNPSLQREKTAISVLDELEEYDRKIDKMSEEELLKDYEDPLEDEKLVEKCVHLYRNHDMTYKQVGEFLRITTTRVRKIIENTEVFSPKGANDEKR